MYESYRNKLCHGIQSSNDGVSLDKVTSKSAEEWSLK